MHGLALDLLGRFVLGFGLVYLLAERYVPKAGLWLIYGLEGLRWVLLIAVVVLCVEAIDAG